ncbi:MAG: amidase [Aquabacterium sp.]|nr:amidase [Aquabacterium sp.]
MKPIKSTLPATPSLELTRQRDAVGGTQLSPYRGIPDAAHWPLLAQDAKILQLSASELARRIQAREWRSEEVVRAFVGQIARHNAAYNAVVLLDLDAALERARAADDALDRGEVWGPLHGVPVTVKDTYAIWGLRTTAGDPDLLNYVPEEDAVIVSLLRRAGAIVLAKTNAATLAMDMQTSNAIFGTTNNPWDVKRTVGGSSGGCAAAVASHMSALSFGSDLAGSIRLPAAYTSIWGLRPTHGVISMAGHMSPKPDEVNGMRVMAVAGPLANSVEDLQLALSVLAQTSPQDSTVAPLKPRLTPCASLRDLKLAYMDELGGMPVSREIKASLQRVVDELRAAGATVVRAEPSDFSYERTWATWGALVGMQGGYERSNLARWFGRFFAKKSVADMPHQRRILDPITVEGYMRALTEKDTQTNALERFLSDYDGWIVPVSSLPPFEHHAPSRKFGIFNIYDKPLQVDGRDLAYYNVTQSYATLFSVTEGPVVSMPAGQSSNGLPVGLQLVGRRFEDWRLLDVAKLLEPLVAKLRGCE